MSLAYGRGVLMSLGAKDRACPGLRRVGCGLAVGFAGCCLLWMLALQPAGALASADANWGAGVDAALPGNASAAPGVIVSSVSCASVGDCTAVGDYFDASGFQGLLLTETAGAWANWRRGGPARRRQCQPVRDPQLGVVRFGWQLRRRRHLQHQSRTAVDRELGRVGDRRPGKPAGQCQHHRRPQLGFVRFGG